MVLRRVPDTGEWDLDRMALMRAGTAPAVVPPAVLRAIGSIRERYYEQITLADLAAEVFVSPFHFSRIFAKATGVTPGRFLTAVRLFEAKRLLLTTSLTVSDIVCSVGYSSVGTFTSRFANAVGMTPTQYRDPEVSELLVAVSPHLQRMPALGAVRAAGSGCARTEPVGDGSLSVRLELPVEAVPANVLVGVFADRVPQCGPVAFGGLTAARGGTITLNGVPRGDWTVIAVADQVGGAKPVFSVAAEEFRSSGAAGDPSFVSLAMRPPQPTDPPIAVTLATRPSTLTPRAALTMRTHLRAVA
ncbi:helix-turn-helix transcriptional regulator [Amycolatopsis sp. NPDC098790]|uniref:helix-turn-helix transcriptional regulator n=1 Tax=Amycolatopsis sp. NPDC098790 TaxID=3363939 RepID=UPI0038051686